MRQSPSLPFSTPAWITPGRIALTSAAAAAIAWALPSIWWISEARGEIRDHRGAMAVVTASTLLLSLLLVRRAVRSVTVFGAVVWCVIGGGVFGVLNAGLCLGGVELVKHGDPGSFIGGLFAGSLFGGLYGGPLGVAYGLAYAVLAGIAVHERLAPSHDGPDRVLAASGAWLAIAGAALIPAAEGSPAPVAPAALAAAGLALAGLALARRRGRTRWLVRAAAGRDEMFRIDPRRGADEEAGLLPVLRPGPEPLDHVVLRRAAAGDPYRGASGWVPVALTP
ncbi:MAG: hypothetical protein IT372_24020 [Polyangiaceae bacterium]|nr:hypothetical protein [Polyangiaceae bacterium]